jgi:hypothetical protein
LTSPESTLSSTLREIQFPRTLKRDGADFPDTTAQELARSGSRGFSDCSACFKILTPKSEHKSDGILTSSVRAQSLDISPLGAVKTVDWGKYLPFVKEFVQKVAKECDDGIFRLQSANISHEHNKSKTNVAFLMRNVGLGTSDQPVSVPRLTYNGINYQHHTGSTVEDRFADTDMSTFKEVAITDCRRMSNFLHACTIAPIPPKVKSLIIHQLNQKDPFDRSETDWLIAFVRRSPELETLVVLTVNDWQLRLLHMLERSPPITTLEISSGTADIDGRTLGNLAALCPRIQHLGIRCSILQNVLEKGTFSKGFLKKLTTLANKLAKFPVLTTLTLVLPMPQTFAKFAYPKQYSGESDRYRVVSHDLYRRLVQAATEANTTCMVKEIRLSLQSAKVFKADKSLRIKCAAEHVFEY